MDFNLPKGQLGLALQRHIDRFPLHVGLFGLVTWLENNCIPSCCVSYGRAGLLFEYNPEFVSKLRISELEGVLHHEFNHVLFGHLDSFGPHDNPVAMIIAEEVTVNEWLREELPGTPITIGDFPGLSYNQSTWDRYEILRTLDLSEYEYLARIQHHRQASLPGEAAFSSALVRAEIGNIVASSKALLISSHLRDVWAKGERGWGELTEADLRKVGKINSKSSMNWGSLLRQYVERLCGPAYCVTMPSRRLPLLLGLVPGKVVRPKRLKIMAVIDTSSSMGPRELKNIAVELATLTNIADLVIVECDTRVRRTYPFQGKIAGFCGGGGTDFRPPFAKKISAKIHPDLLIYFTDGDGPAQETPPPFPVLWCLMPDGSVPASWGRKILMDKAAS